MRSRDKSAGRVRRAGAISIAAALLLVPAAAGARPAAPQVPSVVQIRDVAGDANYLANQMGGADFLGTHPDDLRNRQTPVDASGAADILEVWFTNDASTISVQVRTETPPPGEAAYLYRVYAVPYEIGFGIRGRCLDFGAYVPGEVAGTRTTYQGAPKAVLGVYCPDYISVDGTVKTTTLADGSGLVTMTFRRSDSVFFTTGTKISEPYAASRHVTGANDYHLLIPTIDDTKVGDTYVVKKR